jgi:nucleotide-binding universal stress UspA family protein
MLHALTAILRTMGQGLLHQDWGELAPTEQKISQIEKRRRHYRASGGQSRIVLLASTDPLGPAFDFAVGMAGHSGDKIEVLYVRPPEAPEQTPEQLLQRLTELGQDFQLTYHTGDLYEKLFDYGAQRQDVMAVVCNASEALAAKLQAVQKQLAPAQRGAFPSVLLVGDTLTA